MVIGLCLLVTVRAIQATASYRHGLCCWTDERVNIGQQEICCMYRGSEVAMPTLDLLCAILSLGKGTILLNDSLMH